MKNIHALSRRAAFALALLAPAIAIAATKEGRVPVVARALESRLRSSGRAEARFERSAPDPMGGKPRVVSGTIALEPPDRIALRFTATGERIALRADGGEWLQPKLHQMLELGADRAAAASRWWGALLPGGRDAVRVRDLGPSRGLLVASSGDSASADSAWVWLDARGLPSRLEVNEEPGARTIYRLSGWRFARARGAPSFRIEAPAGYEVVRLP
jgi:outer membrane lipoprotein-sorting protein